MNFTRQLAVFIRSGIPIMEALEVILEETQNKLLRSILLQMVDDLRAGDTFAIAASSHPEAFPAFYIGILESAELTGNLDGVLGQLADYIDRDMKARSKITSALIYPAVVTVMAVVTIIILGKIPRGEKVGTQNIQAGMFGKLLRNI
jgi:type IV pilus assembly protein PilC